MPRREEVFSVGVVSEAPAAGSGSMMNLYVFSSLLASCYDRGGVFSFSAIHSLLYIVLEVYNRSGVFKIYCGDYLKSAGELSRGVSRSLLLSSGWLSSLFPLVSSVRLTPKVSYPLGVRWYCLVKGHIPSF